MTAAAVPSGVAVVGFVLVRAGLVPLIVVLCAVPLAVAPGMLSDPALRWVGTAPRTVVSP
jgi:hypothetical protein